jgi:hypothetical protein
MLFLVVHGCTDKVQAGQGYAFTERSISASEIIQGQQTSLPPNGAENTGAS